MIQIISFDKTDKWDAVVQSFSEHDIFWLNGYVKAFRLHGDGEPLLIYYHDENVRGINVVMKRDIAKSGLFPNLKESTYYDFSTPYGYGGWLIEGTGTEKLFCEYDEWCRNNSIVSEFVRFHPMFQNQERLHNQYEIVLLGNTVAIDLQSPEQIWDNFTSKNRNMIRKAQKNGIVIRHSQTKEHFEQFKEVYDLTMERDNADIYYYFSSQFYESIRCDLAENANVFYAEFEGEIIAASIILNCNTRLNYYLSGSKERYRHLAPTNLLLYEVSLWGCENGCHSLFLGGGVGSQEDNLFRFKKSFNRIEKYPQFAIGKKVFLPEIYDYLVRLRKENILQSSFFPQYRAKKVM